MDSKSIRKTFFDFFQKQEHVLVPSSSLVPENDPSVLLTTAGMQQFKPYFLGDRDVEKDFKARRLASIQRCFRTSDIDLVSDSTHLTFFQMLGNFSFGDYSKDGAIRMAWECLTKRLKVDKQRLSVTVFAGDDHAVKDFEAIKLWQAFLPIDRIHAFGRSENWWGPPGKTGPCGPCSEIHVDLTRTPCERGDQCIPNCPCNRFIEIWNLVFMEFFQSEDGTLKPLPAKNIDTGMGLERISAVLQDKQTVFDTDLFTPITTSIESAEAVDVHSTEDERQRRLRIIADHLRGAVFLVADGVRFLNKEQGYILRRIFRRALDQFKYPLTSYPPVIDAVIASYEEAYPYLHGQRHVIHEVLRGEAESYNTLVAASLKRAHALLRKNRMEKNGVAESLIMTPEEAFELYSTHGISLDRLTREGFIFNTTAVLKLIEDHRKKSRAGVKEKFGGHGLGYSLDVQGLQQSDRERITRLHTATHLLHQALRSVLGKHVKQSGSDINQERLRFDFTHPAKLTKDDLDRVEKLVNDRIRDALPVQCQEMRLNDALSSGALSFFHERYPESVKVYSIGTFSKEICGGPHVENTGVLGHFRILSERSSAAGIRRIKATLG